jgi:hypothetical protein
MNLLPGIDDSPKKPLAGCRTSDTLPPEKFLADPNGAKSEPGFEIDRHPTISGLFVDLSRFHDPGDQPVPNRPLSVETLRQ